MTLHKSLCLESELYNYILQASTGNEKNGHVLQKYWPFTAMFFSFRQWILFCISHVQGTSLEFKSLLSAAARCPSNKLAFEKWRGTLQTSPLHEVLSRTTRTLKGFTRFTISESFGRLVQILKKIYDLFLFA